MDFHRIKQILSQEHTLSSEVWKGAVLFLATDDHVIFIKRSEKMPTHSGQMAFVGGHKRPHETDPWITVLREYGEETGMQSTELEFLGYLPVVMTARLQPIVPVMARLHMSVEDFLKQAKSNGEWDTILAYPWKELAHENSWNYAWRQGYTKGPLLFHTIKAKTYLPHSLDSHLLWGATAAMVWDFLRLYFKHKNEE
jgi:8-oxo-dGTP pyrophosphatase MutT (NUDIX family)